MKYRYLILLLLSFIIVNAYSNEKVLIDFSALTDSSLALSNWRSVLVSADHSQENPPDSYIKEIKVEGELSVAELRVTFPQVNNTALAVILAPPDIIEEADKGLGKLNNVGVIKSISINIKGNNYSNNIGIILMDVNGHKQIISMGDINFEGWKTITWSNPDYIKQIITREKNWGTELENQKLPFIAFVGFIIYKDTNQQSGEFTTYIKDISINFNVARL